MKRTITIMLTALVVWSSVITSASAKDITRYATKTVKLKEAPKKTSKTMCTVKAKIRLTVIKQGKTWATISHDGLPLYVKKAEIHKTKPVNKWKGRSFKKRGRGRWNKWSWTWYTQRQLSGRGLKIPGRHVDKRGFVCDKDGYICLASGRKNKRKKVIVPTPFGKYGKVYDTNGRNNNKWFDVLTAW